MRSFFAKCPKEIKESIQIQKVDKGYSFINAGEPCRNIYILLKGRALAIDMQLQGRVYIFKEFKEGRILGEYECFSGIRDYVITVQAATPCVLGVISAQRYLGWMKSDINALFMRTSTLIGELTMQASDNRRFFLSNCRERLIQYFVDLYQTKRKETLCVARTREQLSNEMGFVVRTIDRNVKKLEKDGYLSVRSGKIYISRGQYEKMKVHLQMNLTYKRKEEK